MRRQQQAVINLTHLSTAACVTLESVRKVQELNFVKKITNCLYVKNYVWNVFFRHGSVVVLLTINSILYVSSVIKNILNWDCEVTECFVECLKLLRWCQIANCLIYVCVDHQRRKIRCNHCIFSDQGETAKLQHHLSIIMDYGWLDKLAPWTYL